MKSITNRAFTAKKRNYIAPNTEMINLSSEGIMQNPSLTINTTSGARTINNASEIE